MSMSRVAASALLAGILAHGSQAAAQSFAFEQSFPATATTRLDVTTERGKITVRAGTSAGIVVVGRVSVRVGWNVPRNAVALARATANDPPMTRNGDTVRLRTPSDERTRRAVTMVYEVQVPAGTEVVTRSESGETRIESVRGAVSVRTQSGAITLADLGETWVETGSGAVSVDGAGPLSVTTSSSRITATRLGAGLYVRTGSGRVRISGRPSRPWRVTTGSSAIEAEFAADAAFSIEAVSGSGSVRAEKLSVQGETSKGRVVGSIAGGGPAVELTSRSGSIRLTSAR